MNTIDVLQEYFGYSSFRKGQEKIINSIISGQDNLAIMSTGAGKSICYQIPALMFSGITLVISPLISLMQDQVKALNDVGIRAAFINSSLNERQISKALALAKEGTYKIIYVAPERLLTPRFLDFAQNIDISMVTVDEAHCISQWGQDFRPSYLKITDFIDCLPKRPIVSAFTATATNEVKDDIINILSLKTPNITITGFDRENLFYIVEQIKNKDKYVIDYIKKNINQSGIIYCATRKNVDKLYDTLLKGNISATKYHAGLDNADRQKNQDDFVYERCNVMIATNAFGMGIDKSNVRYVIHYNMPQSMENYYQEAGRAGRDGEASQCIILFSPQDIVINKFLLENKDFTDIDFQDRKSIIKKDMYRLQVMEKYCKTTKCLRNYILDYFGESNSEPCNNCGNCLREYIQIDMTYQTKWIINCVSEIKERYGINIILGILRGSKSTRLKEIDAFNYKSYGILKDENEAQLKELINQLIEDGFLRQTNDQYSVIKIGNIEPLKAENYHIILKTYDKKEEKRLPKKDNANILTASGYELFEILRKLRLEIAKEEALPPYIIFNDKTIIEMCVKLPKTPNELLKISGVGKNKLEKYGQRFLNAIISFLDVNDDTVTFTQKDFEESSDFATQDKKSRRGLKNPFCINKADAYKFIFKDLYYISEIKDELNRICSVSNVKKAKTDDIWELLYKEDLIYKKTENNTVTKFPTEKGFEYGIQLIDKIRQNGETYKLIKYPPKVQEMILDYMVSKNNKQ